MGLNICQSQGRTSDGLLAASVTRHVKKMVTESPHPPAAPKKIKIFWDMCCNLVQMMSFGVLAAVEDRAASTFYLKMKCM